MADPAAAAQRQQIQQQGLVMGLLTLPFRLFGVLCGSLFVGILIEWLCMAAFWPAESWHHAQTMFNRELEQVSADFLDSLLIHEPGRTTRAWVETTYLWMFIRSGAAAWVQDAIARAHANSMQGKDFEHYLGLAYVHIEAYALAALYTVLTFVVRLLVLLMTLPLFVMAAFAGLVDGLVRRDIRRFGAGRESGYLHHRAKATVMPLLVFPWVTYLALPISISPLLILLPSALVLGAAINVAVGSFKKYL